MTVSEIEEFVVGIGEKPYRAKQIFEWVNKKLVTGFDEMTNLSKEFRARLQESAKLSEISMVKKLESAVDGTRKYLFMLENDNIIESVLMKYEYGNCVCISSQAGCKMGCRFCASTVSGFDRNLTAGEYAAQVYEIQKDIGERIRSIVVMGCGEPFDNYENTMRFIKIVNSKEGLDIGGRHITVSTCGLVDKIYDFADENLQVNLAVSLHAPNDSIRRQIMPVAKRHTVKEIIEACKYYSNTTKRRITYEYALIDGLNDSVTCAKELGALLRHSLCHVNLIPVNSIKENDFRGSSKDKVDNFSEELKGFGIENTIRRKLGADIDAACGQLRKSVL